MTNELESLLDQAKALYEAGQFKGAVDLLHQILSGAPDHLEAHLLFGIICIKSERYDNAQSHLDTVLKQAPENREALSWMAITKKSQEKFDEAIALAQRAVQLEPDALSYNTLGVCYLSKREAKNAIAAFEKAIVFDPTYAAVYQNLGHALRIDEWRVEALEAFQKALDLDPSVMGNWLEVCQQLQWLSRWTDAIEVAQRALERFSDTTAFMIVLANAYSVVKQPVAAEQMYRRAMQLNPSTSQAYAQWLVEEGRFEESLNCLAQSVRIKPMQGYAYFCLAESKRFEVDGEPWLEKAEAAYDSPNLRIRDRVFLDYAIATSLDAQGDYREAMAHFDRACNLAFRMYNAGRPFDHEVGKRNLARRMEFFSAETIAKLQSRGSADQSPILIVGMIRSGTTLLEQIVSSHHDVKAAGELSFWIMEGDRLGKKWVAGGIEPADLPKVETDYLYVLEAMAGKAPRITDKMPLNYEHVGLIHGAFPKAKILHIRRNPLDTCLSIYTTHFGAGPNFAYRQENIAAYYRGYMWLMEHWRKVIPPEQFYELDYEELISSREEATRNVIDFLGLPWDDACLHHENNPSAINTPSRWQARQPIYKTSVERWRRYEPYLGALLDLKDITHPPTSRPLLLNQT